MSGKIEISREMAADLTRKLVTQEDFSRRVTAREELHDLLAAPVVERQEPAQWQRKSQMHEGTWYPLPADEVSEAKRQDGKFVRSTPRRPRR